MDNEVIKTAVAAAGGIQIVGTSIDGSMSKTSIGVGEDDDITRNQVCIGGGSVCVSGYTAICLGSKVLQAGFPCPHTCGGVGTVVHGGCLNCIVNPCGIYTLDIGQIVAHIIGHERGTHQALFLKLRNVRGFTGNGSRIAYGFITITEGGIIVITNVRQNMGSIVFKVAGNILSDIQIAVIFQPLYIVAGVFQRPKNSIIVHLFRDGSHACSHHGSALHFFGEKVVYRHTIRVGMFGIVTLDGLG